MKIDDSKGHCFSSLKGKALKELEVSFTQGRKNPLKMFPYFLSMPDVDSVHLFSFK